MALGGRAVKFFSKNKGGVMRILNWSELARAFVNTLRSRHGHRRPRQRNRTGLDRLRFVAQIGVLEPRILLSSTVVSTTLPAPAGLVSSWSFEGSTADVVDGNNPSASNAVSYVAGEVGQGVSLGAGGYIDIPQSANLDNQQFTFEAWVRPDGAGPNNDEFGSVILGKGITSANSYALTWRATDSRFVFVFGDIYTETVTSTHTFSSGAFHHVAGSYDGTTFRLYVNGAAEGEMALVKTNSFNSAYSWTIGATPSAIRSSGYPRTWNGVIDEVDIFSRALADSEIQAIYAAGATGKGAVGVLAPATV
ncbi:MAG: LamG domain-containing protein, partial [Planctomycetaceae bacterium]